MRIETIKPANQIKPCFLAAELPGPEKVELFNSSRVLHTPQACQVIYPIMITCTCIYMYMYWGEYSVLGDGESFLEG